MTDDPDNDDRALARRIHAGLLTELERAWEDAAMQGLCGEGALEYALDRVRDVDPLELARIGEETATNLPGADQL